MCAEKPALSYTMSRSVAAQLQRSRVSRRNFLAASGGAALSFTIVPRHVLGGPGFVAPSDKVNIASIGAGGMGGVDIATLSKLGVNFVALCDVDDERGAGSIEKPKTSMP
jgi:hypothetical protein